MELLRRSCARRFLISSLLSAVVGLFLVYCFSSQANTPKERSGSDLTPRATVVASKGQLKAEDHDEHHGSQLSFVWKWGNFTLLFGGLAYYFRKPLRDFLDLRANEIQQGLSDARRAEKDAEEKMAAIEARLAGISNEIENLKVLAIRETEKEKNRILERAEAEAEKLIEMAKLEIEGLQRSASRELRVYVAELAVGLAKQRLRNHLGPEANRRIISNFVRALKDNK